MSIAYRPRAEATKLVITKGKTLGEVLTENALDGKLDLVAQYNWGTKVPAEINRALVELVGCEKLDDKPLLTVLDPARGTGGAICKPEPWTRGEFAYGKTHTVKVKKRLPATAAAIVKLPAFFNPEKAETCPVEYLLEGDASRGSDKDFEIHATGYYAEVKDREGAGTNFVEKPSGTVTIGNVKETHLIQKRAAGAPGPVTFTWDGKSEAVEGVLKSSKIVNSACAPYFVSVRYYKDPVDKTAFLRLDPFYPRWNLVGKAKWDLDEKSMIVKWEVQGEESSRTKLKNGQIRLYDKDGLVFFAPLTKEQIASGTYDLLKAPIAWEKAKVEQLKLPYRVQIQAHSDDEEDNGLGLAVMPTQVPPYNYEKVQFIGFNIRNDTTPAGTEYLGHADPDTDIAFRCEAMIQAIQLAKATTETDRKTLKVFMAPEFYFRGKEGAYPVEKISTIVPQLRKETDKYEYLDWLFVFGTALGYQKHEESAGKETRHGTALHKVQIVSRVAGRKMNVRAWTAPQAGWALRTATERKLIAAPPGPMGTKDPDHGWCPVEVTFNSIGGLKLGEFAYLEEPVMTILDTEPTGALTTAKIKVASNVCGRIAVDPTTHDVVTVGGKFWRVESDGKTGWVINAKYVEAEDHYILTLHAPAAYKKGKPLELIEPIASELYNVALMQKGWHAPHLSDGSLREVVTYKEDLSHIDFIRDKSLEFYDPSGAGRKIQMNYQNNVALLPTTGGKDIGGASPNVKREADSAIGSEINKSGLGGGCVIMVDRVTFGMEVCRDHCVHRLFNFYTGTTVRPGDPQVQVQLIPSWGMAIGMCDTGKELASLPDALVFNVDGSRMESVARVADGTFSCDDHLTATNGTSIPCAGPKSTLGAGTLYYICEDCPPDDAYDTVRCTTHPPKTCAAPLRKIGTSIAASSTAAVSKTNSTAYFKKQGSVQVFPVKPLPPPDVSVAPPVLSAIANGTVKPGFEVEITLTGTGLAEVRAVHIDGKNVSVKSFNVVSDTEVKATLSANIFAAVETHNVTVGTLSGASNPKDFKVVAPSAPTLISVTPPSGKFGYFHDIVVKGTNLQSVYSITCGDPKVKITDIKSASDDTYKMEIEVAPDANPGVCTITFKSAGGSATIAFNVLARPLPVVSSVTPREFDLDSVTPGIVLTGTELEFALSVTVSGTGVTADFVTDSDTQLTLKIEVDPGATPGDRNLVVKTLSGDSLSYVIKVVSPPLPTLTDIDPDSYECGFPFSVQLTGTDLDTTNDVVVSGAGVTVVDWKNVTATGMKVKLEIEPTAAAGDRELTVTTLGGTAKITFTVEARSAPTITSVTPTSGAQGATLQITISGSDMLLVKTVGFSGAGVRATGLNDQEDDEIVVTIKIEPGAAKGDRTFTVTNHGGKSNELTFRVV